MSRKTRGLELQIHNYRNEVASLNRKIRAQRDTMHDRDVTLAILYPELDNLAKFGSTWVGFVPKVDWDDLHARAGAIRRAREAKRDKAVLRVWEDSHDDAR